ncbi:MAG TPA: RNase adapter RapZ [Solirubrobacteraceae bacterium]|nr:RNase adapter RapZ [Solirubrobacteraceae bacterium]
MAAIRPPRPAAAGTDGKSKPEPAKPVIETRLQDLVVITGFSGAGKSTAMNVFEDAGYFCVDNLPPEMIRSLVELFVHQGSKVERAAVVSDVRGGVYFEALRAVVDDLDALGLSHHVLFLEAAEQTLVTRYKETRRRHPLAPEGSVAAGVAAERALLAPLREHADLVIDTTGMTASTLRGKIADELLPHKVAGRLALTFMSFGFKHGPPREEDLAFDVRFLANPHYEPELRELTGEDARVVEYIARDGRLDDFYARLHALLDFLLPQYVAEGKSHLVIAIGCTGGRHRSVAIAEHLAERYRENDDLDVAVAHRDIDQRPRGS